MIPDEVILKKEDAESEIEKILKKFQNETGYRIFQVYCEQYAGPIIVKLNVIKSEVADNV